MLLGSAFILGGISMTEAPVVIRRPRQSHTPRTEVDKMLFRLIKEMNHGKVTMVVQDGVIIQVNREETVKITHDSP
jgi:hypothetical protein